MKQFRKGQADSIDFLEDNVEEGGGKKRRKKAGGDNRRRSAEEALADKKA